MKHYTFKEPYPRILIAKGDGVNESIPVLSLVGRSSRQPQHPVHDTDPMITFQVSRALVKDGGLIKSERWHVASFEMRIRASHVLSVASGEPIA